MVEGLGVSRALTILFFEERVLTIHLGGFGESSIQLK
jgi:hypothetical protein